MRDDQVDMKRFVAWISLAAFAFAGCGSDDGGISIDGAWARTSAAGQTTGAIYFEITADEADTLVGASVPASVAVAAEIHEVVSADTSGHDMSEDGGMDMGADAPEDGDMPVTMREMERGLPLPAGENIALGPGSYHVMLPDLTEPLEAGDEIELTLDFETADDITVTVEVMESAP